MATFSFGAFEMDVEAGELRVQGRRIHLAAQPFKVLALLVERHAEVVTRDELRLHVWGEDTFVAFDAGLNFCIAAIRTALNDQARRPRFIETIPRRGYRFLADVRIVETEGRAKALLHTNARQHRRHMWRLFTVAAAALALLVVQQPPRPLAHTRSTADAAAVAAFERGLRESEDGTAGLRRSVYAFREAIARDRRFAEADFALADVYLRLAARRELRTLSALAEARAAALRALALEQEPATHAVLASIRLIGEWDWDGAERDLRDALRLAPEWDAAVVAYARLLSASGDDRAAIAAIDRAEALSPACDLILWDSALLRYRARRYDEALDKLADAETFGPPGTMSSDAWDAQVAWLRTLIEAARSGAAPRNTLAPIADPRARPTDRASAAALAGDRDAAVSWLERAAEEHDAPVVYALRNPEFDRVRDDPRFRAVVARLHPRDRRRTPNLDALIRRSW